MGDGHSPSSIVSKRGIEGEEEAHQVAASSEQRDAELEARFARLADENPQVDDELAELKRRMEQDG